MSHVHVHAPAELTEGRKRVPDEPARGERLLELGAVLLLSLATLATAWSGYEAARWSGEQSQNYARASSVRTQAQRQLTAAGQQRIDDLLNFNGWLNARQAGDRALATTYARRFRSGFVPVFRAWLAQRPFTNPRAVAGPLSMPQYRLPQTAPAALLDAQADALFLAGTKAKSTGDKYVLSTVFFAAVLFFAGISLRLQWHPLRLTVLGLAAVMILLGLGFVASLPVA